MRKCMVELSYLDHGSQQLEQGNSTRAKGDRDCIKKPNSQLQVPPRHTQMNVLLIEWTALLPTK